MNPSGFIGRIIAAIICCIIAIVVIAAVIAAFPVLGQFFTPKIVNLLDILIVALGICYVCFGSKLFPHA